MHHLYGSCFDPFMQSIYATALILYILDETTDDRRKSTTSSIYRDQAGYSTEDGTGRHETAHGTRQHEEPGHDSQWDRDIVASDFLSVLYTETISVQFQMSVTRLAIPGELLLRNTLPITAVPITVLHMQIGRKAATQRHHTPQR